MSIEVEHRGYKIHYAENGDVWRCWDLNGKDAENAALSKVKQAIDRVLLKERKENAVTCYEISSGSSFSAIEAQIIEYIGPKIERPYRRDMSRIPKQVTGHTVKAVAKRRMNDRASAQNGELRGYAPMTPEVEEAIARAEYAKGELNAARKRYEDVLNAIPRMTLADIADLVRISGIDPTGGIKEGD